MLEPEATPIFVHETSRARCCSHKSAIASRSAMGPAPVIRRLAAATGTTQSWSAPGSEITHAEYLHTDESDPRPILIPKLLAARGEQGSIIAYYSQFESSRIKEMASSSVEYSEALSRLLVCIVDPLPLIRDCVYYKEFGCSFSLKSVAPAILGASQSYDGMLVADGTAAQRAFEEIINESTPSQRRSELVQASLEYCKKDTFVMVELVKWLYKQADKK